MSGSDCEAFEDGWHRFHSYSLAGDETLPVVFRQGERHFAAKGMTSDLPNDEAAVAAPGMR